MPAKSKKSQPEKPQSPKRQARRVRIAAAVVAGESVTGIAAAEGLSRSWASQEANSPEVRQIIAGLMDSERSRVRSLFARALQTIEDSFEAQREYVSDGCPVTGGPDHYARLTGAKRFLEFALAGRPPAKEAEKKDNQRLVTLEELERALGVQKIQ